jgi:hypothetical protein
MEKTKIIIKHQIEKTDHCFFVLNPNKLTSEEVELIKTEMGVQMIFVNQKLYK